MEGDGTGSSGVYLPPSAFGGRSPSFFGRRQGRKSCAVSGACFVKGSIASMRAEGSGRSESRQTGSVLVASAEAKSPCLNFQTLAGCLKPGRPCPSRFRRSERLPVGGHAHRCKKNILLPPRAAVLPKAVHSIFNWMHRLFLGKANLAGGRLLVGSMWRKGAF